MPFWIESGNFLQNHRAFDVLHLEPPYEHVNKVDEGELDQSAEHLHSRLYIVFFFFSFIFFISISSRSWDGNSPRQSREWWRCPLPLHIRPIIIHIIILIILIIIYIIYIIHCRCISDLQQKVWKTIASVIHDMARLCFQFQIDN